MLWLLLSRVYAATSVRPLEQERMQSSKRDRRRRRRLHQNLHRQTKGTMLTPGLLSRTIEYNGLDFRRDGLRLQIARTPLLPPKLFPTLRRHSRVLC